MAFVAEYVDATLGMGYGTTLTPLLMLLFGFEPLQVVPAILVSELATGVLAGFTHHSVGNVDFKPRTVKLGRIIAKVREYGLRASWRRGLPLHLRVTAVIALCSMVGTVASVLVAVNIPKCFVKLYIGVLILSIGVVITMTMHRTYAFSWRRIVGLGLVASFNKGISGGGYGPLVTGGQLLSGVEGRSAVGITSLAEGLTCAVGVGAYLLTRSNVDWQLAPFLVAGGVLSVPFAAVSVKFAGSERLRCAIGVVTIVLGTFTLSKLLPV
jgi:uncharacterized membrane protein YfcA